MNIKQKILVFSLLGIMAVLMFFSAREDSAIMDELAHISAGYSYLTQKDYRLNPEHPPLIKDLAALPLLFLRLNFPTGVKAWVEDINGQWDAGRIFLYESGNNPDRILFWSRLPEMLLALVFGWLLFLWIKNMYGGKVAAMALFFFVFSPTIVAHSRYVTTDLAAAFGFFIGIVSFTRFLEKQTPKRIAVAGFALGTALLLKFSLFILPPLLIFFGFLWLILSEFREFNPRDFLSKGLILFGKIIAIFFIAAICVYAVYLFHVWNYPVERQVRDSKLILSSFGARPLADFTAWMAQKPLLRPLAQYLLGLLMVIQRSAGGNNGYFFGEVSSSGWTLYFPAAFLLKEPLPFLILGVIAAFFGFKKIKNSGRKSLVSLLDWARDNFVLFSGAIFVASYWLLSIRSPLNIGVRHITPTYPFIYLFISRQIVLWLHFYSFSDPQNIREWLIMIYERCVKSLPKYITLTFLFVWLVFTVVAAFPHYLSYYNELAGGSKNGFKYIVDSNYDWGQDLKRLSDFVEQNKIKKIAVDYFGGGLPAYYLGGKFEPWQSARGKPNPAAREPEWFAVSATIRQGAFGKPVKGFEKLSEDSYLWLKELEPIARAGHSIFIYKF